VAENVGVTPETKLLLTSLRAIVIVELAVPSAVTGLVPVIVEFAATAIPALKITVPSALVKGPVIERVFVSAVKEVKVQVEIPKALEAEQAV
jgi:hypothetical protein